jgi:hypothetical protein
MGNLNSPAIQQSFMIKAFYDFYSYKETTRAQKADGQTYLF